VKDRALAIYFRHRSTFLLLATWPVVLWTLDGSPAGPGGLLLGSAVAGAGVALRLESIRRIGRGARVHRAHASAGLIVSGPYARMRNPLYVAAGLMLVGLGAAAGGGLLAAALLPLALAGYAPVVHHEERALRDLIGPDFVAYQAQVPRWLGLRRAWTGEEDPSRVPWSEVFRREKLLVPGMALALLGVVAIDHGIPPLGSWIDAVSAALGLPGWAGATLALAASGLVNSVLVERRWGRRSRRPRAKGGGDASPGAAPLLPPR
jgi:protein-S-isoprenylcysteine O-methyltransferase Ste14